MDGYRIPEPDNKLFNKLKAAADNFEYDSVLELINNELQDCSSR